MKLLIDSSTIYSAIVYTGKEMNLLDMLIEKHNIVITDYIIEELKRNFTNKLSKKRRDKALKQLNIFISNCIIKEKNEYIQNISKALKNISDKDAPILACAMLSDIDYLITSDKEFWEIKIPEINVLSPKEAQNKLI